MCFLFAFSCQNSIQMASDTLFQILIEILVQIQKNNLLDISTTSTLSVRKAESVRILHEFQSEFLSEKQLALAIDGTNNLWACRKYFEFRFLTSFIH